MKVSLFFNFKCCRVKGDIYRVFGGFRSILVGGSRVGGSREKKVGEEFIGEFLGF